MHVTHAEALELRPPTHRADPRSVPWWTAQQALWVAPALLVLMGLGVLLPIPDLARWWFFAPAIAVAIVGFVLLAVLPRYRYRNHRWEVSDQAVYARRGWLFVESRIAPTSRIQTVDTTRGPLEQRFGLTTVVVTTASARGPVRISGLAERTANELVDHLTEATQVGDGT